MKETVAINEAVATPTLIGDDMMLPVEEKPSTDGTSSDDEFFSELVMSNHLDVGKVENADRVFEGVKAYIDQNKWRANKEDPKHRIFELCFSMKYTSLKVTVRIEAITETISIITTLPITCLKEYRIIMGRHLNDIGTPPFGAFHLDEDDGEISHRFTYLYTGSDFNPALFDTYLDNCLIASDLNYISIAKKATGSLSTKERLKLNQEIKQLAYAINE